MVARYAAVCEPAVPSFLCAANALSTSSFSRFGTLKKSRVRPSSAATSSNSAGEIWRPRWASSMPSVVAPGLVAVYWKGPPEMLQTQSVRMNLRPGSLPRFLVCHSASRGFLDFCPTMGVLHDGIAEGIDHRRDGEDASQPLVQAFFR